MQNKQLKISKSTTKLKLAKICKNREKSNKMKNQTK